MNKRSFPDDGPFRGRSTNEALLQLRTRARTNAARGLRSPGVATALTLGAGALVFAGVFAMAWNERTGNADIGTVASIDAPEPSSAPVTLVSEQVERQSEAPQPDGASTVSVPADSAANTASPLAVAEQRWGDDEPPEQELTPEQLRSLSNHAAAHATKGDGALAALRSLAQDSPTADSSLSAYASTEESPGNSAVEIAETDAEAAALEAELEMAPQAIDTAPTGAIPDVELSPASVTRYVNLRDGAADEARILAVVPANAEIEAERNCGWCTVVYEGKRGFIYKSFIRHETSEAAAN